MVMIFNYSYTIPGKDVRYAAVHALRQQIVCHWNAYMEGLLYRHN